MASAELELLSEGLTFTGVHASSARGLFEWLGHELSQRGLIRGTWLDAIGERERNYPTGLQFPNIGVAIPHTDPENIERPYIAVVRLDEPVVFRSISADEPPVEASLVVNLGIVHSEGQVRVLQLLMLTLADEETAADIMAQSTPKELYETLIRHMELIDATL